MIEPRDVAVNEVGRTASGEASQLQQKLSDVMAAFIQVIIVKKGMHNISAIPQIATACMNTYRMRVLAVQ